MSAASLILISALINLAALVCYPETGSLGYTFVYISILLWSALAFFITRYSPYTGAAWKAVLALAFALGCAFSALSFLPQKDGVSALEKVWNGRFPDKRILYIGLLRVGIDYPALLPPQKEEPLP
jgi:hypothetical protein